MGRYLPHNLPKERVGSAPLFEQITVTTDDSGNAEVTSDNYIIGELLGIYYDDGTVTSSTTAVITATTPITLQLDSYDINSNDAFRIPKIKTQNTTGSGWTDDWGSIYLHSKVVVTVTGGQVEKTFYVYIVYK